MVVPRNYWELSLGEQQKVIKGVQRLDLEEYAREHELVIFKGEAIRPEEYPCRCELLDPDQCRLYPDARDLVETGYTACACPCHTYYEPY